MRPASGPDGRGPEELSRRSAIIFSTDESPAERAPLSKRGSNSKYSPKKPGIDRAFMSVASAASEGTSSAVVVQHAGSWPGDAGNRAEVFIDRAQVVVSHILKREPGHYLQQITVEGQVDREAAAAGRNRRV